MPESVRPTNLRYVIILVTMFAAVLLYLERVCLGIAEVFIREDLNLSDDQVGNVFMAFFLAYALGQVPAGWLAQRFGPRLMMSLFMLGLAVFGVMIAAAQNYLMLVIARFLLGASQAGAYPAAAILVKRWVPDRDRGFASSVVAFGGRFGGACANWLTGLLIVAFVPASSPVEFRDTDILKMEQITQPSEDRLKEEAKSPHFQELRTEVRVAVRLKAAETANVADALTTFLPDRRIPDRFNRGTLKLSSDGKAIIDTPVGSRSEVEVRRLNRLILEQAFPGAVRQLHERGWRPTLITYGIGALILAVGFWIIARDYPRQHPWCNTAEREYIEQGQLIGKDNVVGNNGIPWMKLLSSRNQWICSCFHLFNNIGWVFLITYLPRFLSERFEVPVDTRGLMSTIPLFVAAFAMLLGGKFTDRLSKRYGLRIGRVIPMSLFKIPCVLMLVLCPHLPTAWAVVIALSIMSMSTDFGIPAAWAFAQDTGGKQAATVLGWVNMWGNLGAALGAKFLKTIQTEFGWDALLYTCAGAFMMSGLFAAFTRADKPLE